MANLWAIGVALVALPLQLQGLGSVAFGTWILLQTFSAVNGWLSLADAELLMAWRNDPDTVRFSRSARPVTASEHREWLRSRLADPSSRVWIGEETGRPVGQVRVDREGEAWIVGIAVAPGDRGRGLSPDLLRGLQNEMRGCTGAGTLRAEVHRDNLASRRAFASTGFVRGGEAEAFVSYEWEW